jgi:hypothetical protein
MSDVIPSTSEPIRVSLSDSSGVVTGATLRARVVNLSTGLVWNWTAVAFQSFATAGANQWQALPAVDATNLPGVYQGATSFPVPAGAGYYEARIERDAGAGYLPLAADTMSAAVVATLSASIAALAVTLGTLATLTALAAVSGVVDTVRKRLTNRRSLAANGVESMYDDDGTTVLKTRTYTDVTGAAVTVNAGEPARASAES